jgi:hypothetical protein
MYFKLVARTGAVLLSALALAGVAATSAMAAENSAVTYRGYGMCVKGTAHQYPYVAGGFGSGATVDAEPYDWDCSTPLQLSQGDVAAKADVYKWTGSSWAYCTGTDWVYGGYTSGYWIGDIYESPTYGAIAPSSAGSCGPGYYGVLGSAYAYGLVHSDIYVSGYGFQWNGGTVWSGYEYIG